METVEAVTWSQVFDSRHFCLMNLVFLFLGDQEWFDSLTMYCLANKLPRLIINQDSIKYRFVGNARGACTASDNL